MNNNNNENVVAKQPKFIVDSSIKEAGQLPSSTANSPIISQNDAFQVKPAMATGPFFQVDDPHTWNNKQKSA